MADGKFHCISCSGQDSELTARHRYQSLRDEGYLYGSPPDRNNYDLYFLTIAIKGTLG